MSSITHPTGAARAAAAPGIAVLVLLLGTYLFGLGHIATLPPFEGFDEPGHYSYIAQLALTGTWPRHGDPMAATVDDYLKAAPTAAAIEPVWSYAGFFGAAPAVVTAGEQTIHALPAGPLGWRPGTIDNWEAQHPPLYYAMLAPVFRLTAGWSLGAQLLVLRLLSYSLAWSGLCLAAYAASANAGTGAGAASTVAGRLAPALWPLLLPMWFPEMGRLGNDSLVILIVGVVALLLTRALRGDGGWGIHLAIGVTLGLGLLTKATFLPLTAASLILLACRGWINPVRGQRRGLGDVVVCVAAILAVAGWWYARQVLETGTLIGSNDAINLAQNGALLEGLRQHGSGRAFLRLPGGFALSMAWTGTWSFVTLPLPFLVLLVIGWLPLGAAAVWRVLRTPLTLHDAVAPLTLLLFLAGLLYQSVILIATIGSGAPAWYLHAFLPVLWPLVAWGLAGALAWRPARLLFLLQLAYAPLFLLLAACADILFYAGCGLKQGTTNYFDLASTAACLAQPALVFQHLQVLAFPALGLGAFVAGYGLLVLGAVGTVRAMALIRPPREQATAAEGYTRLRV